MRWAGILTLVALSAVGFGRVAPADEGLHLDLGLASEGFADEGLLCGPRKATLYGKFWPRGVPKSAGFFYDHECMPPAQQVWDEGLDSGIRHAGGANLTFPWRHPAGIPDGSNVKTIERIHLPGAIEWWRSVRSDGTFARFRWEYPAGTRADELLLVTDPDGYDHTSIVRSKLKRASGAWSGQSYQPWPTEASFVAEFGKHFHSTPLARTVIDSGHERNAFSVAANGALLPVVPRDVLASTLDAAEFLPTKGTEWLPGIAAPTARSFSVVPIGYFGSHTPTNNQACMRCHQDAGKVVNEPGEAEWRLRGDDGIFSFHIFEPSSVGTTTPRLNLRLVAAGLLKHKKGMP